MSSHRLTDSTKGYVTLGTIVTSAPKAALLLALRRMRPQCTVRLQPCGKAGTGEISYRVELRADELDDTHSIDAWLRIKSVLIAAFPADTPHAVRATEA